jgi:uncharacterized protein with FMN-binding domain
MRTALIVTLTVAALAVPNIEAFAATKAQNIVPKKRVVIVSKSFDGSIAQADRWGNLQVTIVVKKTTTTTLATKKTTVTRRITKVTVPMYPQHTDRSIFINEQALPLLVQETLQAQSTGINIISGATASSFAFGQSLRSAILQAKSW